MKRFASDRVAGLMQRFGIEEDVPIESGIVSKTIEGAQSRVEGFNFDMRKRVVELDDVINKQRETIYRERDKILRNEDLTETVQVFLEDEVGVLIDDHVGERDPSEWTLDDLSKALVALGLPEPDVSVDRLAEMRGAEAMRAALGELVERQLQEREREVGETDWAMVERLVLLRTVDGLWVEHLTELDDLRRGIHLRGYAQTDPVNAFKVEAYRLYQELQGLIRHQVASTILRVSVVRQPQEAPQPMPMVRPLVPAGDGRARGAASGRTTTVAGSLATSQMAEAAVRGRGSPTPGDGGRKLGRNDPCWCGSGKKYKRCHGA
jgi:preprotein translocase subunit SecA